MNHQIHSLTKSADAQNDQAMEFQTELSPRLPILLSGEEVEQLRNDVVDESDDESRQIVHEEDPHRDICRRNQEIPLPKRNLEK